MADKALPLIALLLQPGALWRGLAHRKTGGLVDMGDIAILEHTSKGIECYLFTVQQRWMLPYLPDTKVWVDKENHIRLHDGEGNIAYSLAPAE